MRSSLVIVVLTASLLAGCGIFKPRDIHNSSIAQIMDSTVMITKAQQQHIQVEEVSEAEDEYVVIEQVTTLLSTPDSTGGQYPVMVTRTVATRQKNAIKSLQSASFSTALKVDSIRTHTEERKEIQESAVATPAVKSGWLLTFVAILFIPILIVLAKRFKR